MAIDEVFNQPWTRKHDNPRFDLIQKTHRIVYPKSLEELIELCRSRPADVRLKAAGSHWALSEAALSDHTFIETHDPRNVHQAMGKTLDTVVPKCLNANFIGHLVNKGHDEKSYLVHVEAGKRIYQLYAELDQPVDVDNEKTLAGVLKKFFDEPGYGGPWAFATLGGAGGQTVVGAFNTGTHGGDWDRPPLSDSVAALHLVADGGKHYWIEPVIDGEPPLTDDVLLKLEYGKDQYGGINNFELVRDTELFRAVLVSAGRFGTIYSAVLRAVPQYSLHEYRRLVVWQDIKADIKKLQGPLYKRPDGGSARFLQIVVCLTPQNNFIHNAAGVTKRWNVPFPAAPQGRAERVGTILKPFDERIQGPLFAYAGKSHPYSHDSDDPSKGGEPSFLERACSDGSFLAGVLEVVIEEVEDVITSKGAVIGGGVAVVAAGGGTGILMLIPQLLVILVILKALLDAFDSDDRMGEHMEGLKNELLDPNADPVRKAAGLFVWQLIAHHIFELLQSDQDFEAISYAVMDRRDYRNVSCEVHVESLEVFFDAVDDRLTTFVDSLIVYERLQEINGLAFLGYASLRFMKKSDALLGMQRYPVTCAVEIAGLRDVSGTDELIKFAVDLARHPQINGILHWGQRNDCDRQDIERLFDKGSSGSGGDLTRWRQKLGRITRNGKLDGFSSDFTRRTGLEVVTPQFGTSSVPETASIGSEVTVTWDCSDNPPGTEITVQVLSPGGTWSPSLPVALKGAHTFRAAEAGSYFVLMLASLKLNGIPKSVRRSAFVAVS